MEDIGRQLLLLYNREINARPMHNKAQLEAFGLTGMRPHMAPGFEDGDLGQLRGWLDAAPNVRAPNGVLMDATCLEDARRLLLEDSSASPSGLLNLAAFVTAAVFFDHIAYFGDDVGKLEALKLERGLLRPIRLPRVGNEIYSGAAAAVLDLWAQTTEHFKDVASASTPETKSEQADLVGSWGKVLGSPIAVKDLRAFTLGDYFTSPSDTLLEELTRATLPDEKFVRTEGARMRVVRGLANPAEMADLMRALPLTGDELASLIGQSNHRSYFNLRMAQCFDIPYLPSASRLPNASFRHRRTCEIHDAMSTVTAIQTAYRSRLDSYHLSERPDLELPFALASVIAASHDKASLLDSIRHARAVAVPFRERKRELDLAIAEGQREPIEKLRAALAADAKALIPKFTLGFTVGAVITVAAALAAAPIASISWGFVALGGLLSGGVSAREEGQLLASRLCRPQFGFLTDLRGTADAFIRVAPQVVKIWPNTIWKEEHLAERWKSISEIGFV